VWTGLDVDDDLALLTALGLGEQVHKICGRAWLM
jgi:hypothetical protein